MTFLIRLQTAFVTLAKHVWLGFLKCCFDLITEGDFQLHWQGKDPRSFDEQHCRLGEDWHCLLLGMADQQGALRVRHRV